MHAYDHEDFQENLWPRRAQGPAPLISMRSGEQGEAPSTRAILRALETELSIPLNTLLQSAQFWPIQTVTRTQGEREQEREVRTDDL